MSHAKKSSKQTSRMKSVPVWGAAGLSLSLAGGAAATTGGPAADIPTDKKAPNHEITLGEEEISDVSLRRFMSSTRRTPEPPSRASSWPTGAADAAAVAAAVEGAAGAAVVADGAAVVAAAAVAAAGAGAAVAAVCLGAVVASARRGSAGSMKRCRGPKRIN